VEGLIGKEKSSLEPRNHFSKDTENPKLQAYHKLAAVTVFKEQNNIQTSTDTGQKLLVATTEQMIKASGNKIYNENPRTNVEYNNQHLELKSVDSQTRDLNNFNTLYGVGGNQETGKVKEIPTGTGMTIRYASNIKNIDGLIATETSVLSKMNKAYTASASNPADSAQKTNQVRGALTISERTVILAFNPPPPVYVGDSTELRMDNDESKAANEVYLNYVNKMKTQIDELVASGVKPKLEIVGGVANMSVDGKTTHAQHALSFARSSLVVGFLLDGQAKDAGEYMADKHESFDKVKGKPVRDKAVSQMNRELRGGDSKQLLAEFSKPNARPEATYTNKENTISIKVVSAGQSRNSERLGEILSDNKNVQTFAGKSIDKLTSSKVMEQIRLLDVNEDGEADRIQSRDYVLIKNFRPRRDRI
jgi:hypothetical protein